MIPFEISVTEASPGGDRRLPSVAAAGDAAIVLAERFDQPSTIELLRGSTRENLFQASELSAETGLRGVRSELVHWAATDGAEVSGLLLQPAAADVRGLLVWIHGGPVSLSTDRWAGRADSCAYLLAQGYAVFRPNPRGSVGNGRSWIEALAGDLGGIDGTDVLAGVDHVVHNHFSSATPLAIGGESYGGFLSAWLVTKTQRFAAAIVSSPITSWETFDRESNIPRFAEIFLGPSAYKERSPLRYSSLVRTATLTMVGGLDKCTPPVEGRQWHDALTRHGLAPTKLVEFGDVGHVPRDFPRVIDYGQAISDWLNEHLT
jgi:dipeptidyl aminopeptidase/acylaminoacyl peptidase